MNIRRPLIIAAAVASLALVACSTTNVESLLTTFSKDYAHCNHTLNYSANIGGLGGTATGAQMQGTINCPPEGSATNSTSTTVMQVLPTNATTP